MRILTLVLLLSAAVHQVHAQEIYFPPNVGNTWETIDPASLGWCTDQVPPLLQFLEDNNTKAFIVLKDGRIAIEQYFGTFTQDSSWYWASAGKSLTAFLVGLAQEDGSLNIDDVSSGYLGTGWTSATPEQEAAITIRHQLTMTTGLDDGTGDVDCTDPVCLQYLADPGTRWAYHNAPYTHLDGVIAAATGQTLNAYLFSKLSLTTGLYGAYVQLGYNNVFFSTPRRMARFGLLAMNGGNWNGTPIMADTDYFQAMTTPSQTLNNSYGYLWWLNGQQSFMVPGLQLVFQGSLMPNEPPEAINALGKNGQVINIVPSQGVVVVRMGNAPGAEYPVPTIFSNDMWAYLNTIFCSTTGTPSIAAASDEIILFPTPVDDQLRVNWPGERLTSAEIIMADGRTMTAVLQGDAIDVRDLMPGSYWLRLRTGDGKVVVRPFQIAR